MEDTRPRLGTGFAAHAALGTNELSWWTLEPVWGKGGWLEPGKEAGEVCGWVCEECSLPFSTAAGWVDVPAAWWSFTTSLLLSWGLWSFTMAFRGHQKHRREGEESGLC